MKLAIGVSTVVKLGGHAFGFRLNRSLRAEHECGVEPIAARWAVRDLAPAKSTMSSHHSFFPLPDRETTGFRVLSGQGKEVAIFGSIRDLREEDELGQALLRELDYAWAEKFEIETEWNKRTGRSPGLEQARSQWLNSDPVVAAWSSEGFVVAAIEEDERALLTHLAKAWEEEDLALYYSPAGLHIVDWTFLPESSHRNRLGRARPAYKALEQAFQETGVVDDLASSGRDASVRPRWASHLPERELDTAFPIALHVTLGEEEDYRNSDLSIEEFRAWIKGEPSPLDPPPPVPSRPVRTREDALRRIRTQLDSPEELDEWAVRSLTRDIASFESIETPRGSPIGQAAQRLVRRAQSPGLWVLSAPSGVGHSDALSAAFRDAGEDDTLSRHPLTVYSGGGDPLEMVDSHFSSLLYELMGRENDEQFPPEDASAVERLHHYKEALAVAWPRLAGRTIVLSLEPMADHLLSYLSDVAHRGPGPRAFILLHSVDSGSPLPSDVKVHGVESSRSTTIGDIPSLLPEVHPVFSQGMEALGEDEWRELTTVGLAPERPIPAMALIWIAHRYIHLFWEAPDERLLEPLAWDPTVMKSVMEAFQEREDNLDQMMAKVRK